MKRIALSMIVLLGLTSVAGANELLRLLPGASSGGGQSLTHLRNLDDQRRRPALRHRGQMARLNAQRDFQRRQAERAWSGTVTAPAADNLPVLVRPTVFSYTAALDSLLRIAEGDRVNFVTAGKSGFIELLKISGNSDRTCRNFRQEVRTPKGPEISYGSACRLRGGQWQFTFG